MKAPKANANFNIFYSQCPIIKILSKALKVNSLSVPSGIASLSIPSRQSTTHPGNAGDWNESILSYYLPKVS